MRESESTELKKSTSEMKEAIISIVAILNKRGKGELYFGVKDDGTIVGQQVGEGTVHDVSRMISEHIEPRAYPKVERVRLGRKDCIRVEFSGDDAPYFAYGRAYMRVGDEDRQMSARELERIIRGKSAGLWEKQFSEKGLKDVSAKAVREYMRGANAAGRIDFRFTDVRTALSKLGLLKRGRLLRAAEILFCNENPLRVQLAVFAGIDKLTFLDIQQYEGNLFTLLRKSELYIKEHMDWRADLTASGRREIPEIPLRAITEALVNSFCHRDYNAPESNYIAIFKDRISIYNPGPFPEGRTPEEFIKGAEKSLLRNPLIADVLYKSKEIEKWGSGLKRIYEACTASGVKFEFVRSKSGFEVVFHRGVTEKVTEKVTENQRRIISEIVKNGSVTARELSGTVGISERKIKENMKKLKEKNLIRRVGPDKGGRWEVR